jgi:hypothetical protein
VGAFSWALEDSVDSAHSTITIRVPERRFIGFSWQRPIVSARRYLRGLRVMEFIYLVKLALGMVAKRRTSVYAEHGWLKIKNPKYTQAERRHDMFQAFRGPVKKA